MDLRFIYIFFLYISPKKYFYLLPRNSHGFIYFWDDICQVFFFYFLKTSSLGFMEDLWVCDRSISSVFSNGEIRGLECEVFWWLILRLKVALIPIIVKPITHFLEVARAQFWKGAIIVAMILWNYKIIFKYYDK